MDRDKMEQSLQRSFHRYYLPNFSSFGKVVSEEKNFQKLTNQKQEWSVAAMFVNGSGRNEQFLQRTFHRCFLPSFGPFGQAVSEEKIFIRPIRNKNCLWRPCLLMDIGTKLPIFIEDFPQMLLTKFQFIWESSFRGEDFLENNQSKTRKAWVHVFNGSELNEQSLQRNFQGCFLPSFDSFGQAVSEEKIFLNRPFRNKNCLPLIFQQNIYRRKIHQQCYRN